MPAFEKSSQRNGSGDQRLNGKTEFEQKRQRHASGESTISTDSISNYIPTPPDGGYGWVIVFASFMNHVIVDGIAFTFGIFYGDFLDYFNSGKGETALVGSLLSGFYLLTAPVAGSLINKFGCRPVAITGSIIGFLGFSLSTLSTNIKWLSLTYGAIGGFGLGLLYLPNVVAVSYYFHQRRALATGIAVCGAGVGCFVFAPVGQWLLRTYAWKNAMLLVAGVTLHGCIFGALLRNLEPVHHRRKPRAKNIFDRLKEEISTRNRTRKMSEVGPVQEDIKQKVQVIKTAREKVLNEEESESTPALCLNSVDCLQQSNPSKEMKLVGDNGEIPMSAIIPDVVVEGVENKQGSGTLAGDDCCLETSVENNKQLDDELTTSGKKKVDLAPGMHVMFVGIGNRYASEQYLSSASNSKSRKLPLGIHRADFARPLYRSDIFYSGSFINIPDFHSQPNMNTVIKSLTAIPDEFKSDKKSYLCHCIPISKSVKDTLRNMTDISLLYQPVFLIPCLANLFGAIGLFIPFVYSSDRAISLGVEPQSAAFLLSVIGITNTLGRILAGFLANLKHVSPLALHNAALIAGGCACILNMFCVTYPLLCLFAAFFGLCVATWISLTSIVLCNMLGLEHLTNAFGLLTMTRGVATLMGSPIAGLVFDATKDYNTSFHIGGSMLLLGGLLCCLLHLPVFSKTKGTSSEDLDNQKSQLKNC